MYKYIYIYIISLNFYGQCNGSYDLCNKRYNEVAYLTTHNAFNSKQDRYLFPNQKTNITEQLNNGETNIFAPIVQQTINSGMSELNNGLWFTAPGANNYGSVKVDFDISSIPWLAFDWDADNTIDDTSARLYFGYYRGSDRVIYWKEVRN